MCLRRERAANPATFHIPAPASIATVGCAHTNPMLTPPIHMCSPAAGYEGDMYHPLLQTCRCFQPDVIVADMTTLAAHDVAETLKLPLALLGSMPLSLALDLTGVLGC